jgi:hypothetical protein
LSIKLMTAVWESDVQPAGKRLVLLALADSANDEGVCWPSMATIARKAGIGLSSARKACAALEEEGLLVREERRVEHARNKSNIYVIQPGKLAARAAQSEREAPAQIRRGAAQIEREVPLNPGGGAAQIERENRNKNHQIEPSMNQSAATGDAAPADGLFSADEVRANSGLEVKGNDVVAAYVDAYREAHQGHDPLQADIRKVAGAASRLLKDAAVKPHVALQAATALGRTQFTDLAGQYRRSLQGSNSNQDPTRGYFRAEQKNVYVPPVGETPAEANARVERDREWLKAYNAGTATLADRPE